MGTISQIYPEKHERWLPDYACLWRYVPLRTLLVYLTGSIFIPAVETLRRTDPFEGKFLFDTVLFNTVMHDSYGDRSNELDDWLFREYCSDSEKKHIELIKDYPNYAARIFENHYFSLLRRTRYAWCWFFSDSASAAMWNNYGKQGVAIATTVGKLRGVLQQTGRDFAFGQMRYIRVLGGEVRDYDFSPENTHDASFLLRPYFLKRKEYESEREVRFVTAAPEREDRSGMTFDRISPLDWIREIQLWPGLKPLEEEALKQVISHFAPDVPCACSDLFRAERSLSDGFLRVMADQFDELGWTGWKDGSDGIPPELKQL